MLRSLYSGISGVKNQQAQLDVISNNIANVNTTGYKSSRMTFADALSETISGARGTAGNFGGANPVQIGRGASISSVDTMFKQGSLDSTGIITDLAVNGKGFFVVTDGSRQYYSRAGAFQIQDDGSLMSQGGAFYVMGRSADENGKLRSTTAMEKIVLPFGRKEPAKATTDVDIYCNLNKNASTAEEWLGKDQLLADSEPVTLATDLALVDGNNIMLGDVIEITGTNRDGQKILDSDNKVWTFTYGKDGTTMQDFIDKINTVFNSSDAINGATVSLDQSGRLRLIANTAGENDFSIFLTPKATANHTATTENRTSSSSLETFVNNQINELNSSDPAMNYQAGDTVDITYNGSTETYTFVTGNETLQDIADFMNENFTGANVGIVSGTNIDDIRIQDVNDDSIAIAFAGSAGSGANGLDGLTQATDLILTADARPASTSTDLKHILNSSILNNRTINIEGTNSDGTYVSGTFVYGETKDGTTVQDLLNKINDTFYGVTATMDETGTIILTDNSSGESLSSIDLSSGTSAGFDIGFETEIFTASSTYVDSSTSNPATGVSSLSDIASVPYTVGEVISIHATQLDGVTKTHNYTFTAGATLQDFVDDINNSNIFTGMEANIVDGQIVFTDATLSDSHNYTSIQIVNAPGTAGRGLESTFTSNAGTNNSSIKVPSFSSVQEGETGKHHSAITVFDSAGQSHTIEINYTQDTTPGSNKWFWEIVVDEGKIKPHAGGSGTVLYNDNGSLKSFHYDNGNQLRFNVLGADEVKIDLNAGTPGAFDGMTQMDSASTNVLIEQNGYSLGVLNNINVDDQGIITGIYSNGVSKSLAQVAIATFTNEGGLQKEGNSLFSANNSSGNAITGWAGQNNSTVIKSGYLESSNVDLTDEFAKLIISQRALDANAKVISTSDTILSTIIDRMKR
jgi:flagellar hook protein FlgE